MELSLSDEQQTLLVSILQETVGGVREEVYKAEVSGYRDDLRKKEDLIRGLLTQLGSAPGASR